jgi:WD40 repeat protein
MIPALTVSKQFANKKITALCFSPDKKYCAVAFRSTSSVSIYTLPQDVHLIDKWTLLCELREQTQTICSLDWSCTNKILSCSYDRSVLIWNFTGKGCTKELVYCQNKLSILHGEWSPSGKKFAIGTSCKKAYLGYF